MCLEAKANCYQGWMGCCSSQVSSEMITLSVTLPYTLFCHSPSLCDHSPWSVNAIMLTVLQCRGWQDRLLHRHPRHAAADHQQGRRGRLLLLAAHQVTTWQHDICANISEYHSNISRERLVNKIFSVSGSSVTAWCRPRSSMCSSTTPWLRPSRPGRPTSPSPVFPSTYTAFSALTSLTRSQTPAKFLKNNTRWELYDGIELNFAKL